MSHTKRLFVFAGAALSLGSATVALAGESVSRDEVRAIVAEVLADSETRSSLLQGGGSAGYDKHFFLASVDNNYRLNFSGYAQFRYIADFRDNDAPDDNFDGGFQSRRVRLEFHGHVVSPELKFFISGDFQDSEGSGVASPTNPGIGNQAGGGFTMKDAFLDYDFAGGFYIKGGQYKLPFLRDELVSDTKQIAVDRSLVNFGFTGGRAQGVELGYRDEAWWFGFSFSDGFNSANTDINSANESDYAFTARGEYAFAGKRDDFAAFTSMQEDDFQGLVGVAGHYQGASNTRAPTDEDPEVLVYTADLTLKGGGFSFFVAAVGTYVTTSDTAVAPGRPGLEQNDYALTGQAAYRFLQDTEAFVRYDGIYLDDDAGAGAARAALVEENYNFLTFGINQYFAGHAAKLTIDAVVSLDRGDGATRLSGANILPQGQGPSVGNSIFGTQSGVRAGSDDNAIAVRAQFQLMF